jgi:hypothetical protein
MPSTISSFGYEQQEAPAMRLASILIGPYDEVVDEYESGRPGYPGWTLAPSQSSPRAPAG